MRFMRFGASDEWEAGAAAAAVGCRAPPLGAGHPTSHRAPYKPVFLRMSEAHRGGREAEGGGASVVTGWSVERRRGVSSTAEGRPG